MEIKCPDCGCIIRKRTMNATERKAVESLAGCTYRVGCYNKRFVRNMKAAVDRNLAVTPSQIKTVWRLTYRYRRQIQDSQLIMKARRKVARMKAPPLQLEMKLFEPMPQRIFMD